MEVKFHNTEDIIVEEAMRECPPDYAAILGIEPPRSESGRTAPEIAYRAMREALDGLTPAELRKLAPLVNRWKGLSPRGRKLLDRCSWCVVYVIRDEEQQRRKKRAKQKGVVYDFKECRAQVRYLRMRENGTSRAYVR